MRVSICELKRLNHGDDCWIKVLFGFIKRLYIKLLYFRIHRGTLCYLAGTGDKVSTLSGVPAITKAGRALAEQAPCTLGAVKQRHHSFGGGWTA